MLASEVTLFFLKSDAFISRKSVGTKSTGFGYNCKEHFLPRNPLSFIYKCHPSKRFSVTIGSGIRGWRVKGPPGSCP